MKYLIIEEEFFYDGHGEEAAGETIKKVITDYEGDYKDLDPSKTYTEDLDEIDPEDVNVYAEDGYHGRQTFVRFKKITDDEAKLIEKMIDVYNSISV